jgi:MFS family permease
VDAAPSSPVRRHRVHPAWIVAGVSFVALIGAAGFRSAPGVLMVPMQDEFGWSRTLLSVAVGINLILYGLTAPFAAALMDRFGIRVVTSSALVLVALGSGLTVLVNAGWQLVLSWGVLIGLGTGSMALVFAATIANRWFVRRRGLVMGVLTAASATGQLIFLPLMAWLAEQYGWRAASLMISLAALAVVPLVLRFVRNYPADVGVRPYGAAEPSPVDSPPVDSPPVDSPPADNPPAGGRREGAEGPAASAVDSWSDVGKADLATDSDLDAPPPSRGHWARGDDGDVAVVQHGAVRRTLVTLREAARTRTFWALAIGFAICGATTNGIIGTHFVPAAVDHGMPSTTAAGLLAVVGIFDIVGTIASGALTDRFNPRLLLAFYYTFRGVGLLMLPALLSDSVHPSMLAFVIVYGLDWVATVPPTAALCADAFGEAGTIVFGWVFASHMIGAALASVGAGYIRDLTSDYTMAWLGAAGLCAVAALMSLGIRKVPRSAAPVAH